MSELLRRIDSMALFRGVRNREPLNSLCEYLLKTEGGYTIDETIAAYSKFVAALYEVRSDADLSGAIWDCLVSDMNPFLRHRIDSVVSPGDATEMSTLITLTAERELDLLTEIGNHTSTEFKEQIFYDGYLPDFRSSHIDMKKRYMRMIDNIERDGYGIFAKYIMFCVKEGQVVPVKHPDPIKTDDLYCYEIPRKKVIDNTAAFIAGKPAADVLLYGDAGTGKSSTVKAVSRMFAGAGVRLVEVPKQEIRNISSVIERLSQVPMKFIIFLDDISFEADDPMIGIFKSVLEGAASGGRKNIVIYATSNRRHIVKESFADRQNEVHLTDTIAEQTSLSERFGLRILFDKPNKKDYLEIVKKLASSRGITMPEEELEAEAEKFALRGGGRTARLARQFIDSLCC